MRTILRSLLPLVALFLTATVAFAQPDPMVEARAHYMAGKDKFAAAQYDEAVAEFRAAEALVSSPVNDFNIALALDRKGDAAGAVASYRTYLNRSPNATNRAEVEASIARLSAAASAAEAAAAEAARREEAARLAEEQRRAAEAAATRPATPAPTPTGDPLLDRVAMVDLSAARGAQALPVPADAQAAPAAGPQQPAPAGDSPTPSKTKPFYKSPVFWVLAAVGVYVLITLADDSNNTQASGLMLQPVGAPSTSGGATLFRF